MFGLSVESSLDNMSRRLKVKINLQREQDRDNMDAFCLKCDFIGATEIRSLAYICTVKFKVWRVFKQNEQMDNKLNYLATEAM